MSRSTSTAARIRRISTDPHSAGREPAGDFAQRRRIKCGWGEWSLVAATLEALRPRGGLPGATHFYMLSGDCMPIKTAEYAHAGWSARCRLHRKLRLLQFGLDQDRDQGRAADLSPLVQRAQQKALFYRSMDWQKRLGLKRKVPADLAMRIGSQWWCLRRRTVEAVLEFIRKRPM
jgi:hypothetical protein